ncbi:hypothetical protein SISNIDRAFT_404337 [Sistotremastrum niveocremeum HHB9708]|uniref:Polysaccharide lyase 14 domain-containing protein n=1 Tax=Sistotremastrum niveocremeum HHB9708 TaxID=1314777 RepID=A0A165A9A2_9AGAM|nr:hypothetical protein SISNIDRAFT_404337 [Sistotremastrum niveocremeum HHB9708]
MSSSFKFPVPVSRGWATATSIADSSNIEFHELSDALGVHKISQGTSHRVVEAPEKDSTQAWEAFYPEGSINPSGVVRGGFGFYLDGPSSFSGDFQKAQHVVAAYSVMFQDGWEFNKGGKLPGIYGGHDNFAYGCTGGRQSDRCSCFNLRLMWRKSGVGELYAYLPDHPSNKENLEKVPPFSEQNPDYGFSVGRGAFKFRVGKWNQVVQRVKLNDVGSENGEIEIWIDGVSVISVGGIVLRVDSQSCVHGIHFQTFFGGHTPDWASPRDQTAWFCDIAAGVVAP